MTGRTRRALVGATTATAVGVAVGAVARAARGSDALTASALTRSAPGRLVAALPDAWTRLVASLEGTGATFAQLALLALFVVSAAAAVRAVVLWLRVRRSGATAAEPRAPRVRAPSIMLSRLRRTPARPVAALASNGASRAEIARRTGLSRDAIALALHLGPS